MQSGCIKELQLQNKKQSPFQKVSSLELVEGIGIIGDCHSIGGEKQIALISLEAKEWMETQEPSGLCMSRFQENVVTQGINYSLLERGERLEMETVTLQIAAYSKRCFLECELVRDEKPCKLKTGIIFAKVMKTGTIHVGDRIWTNTD